MKLKHFTISQQGKSHIERDANCQDQSASRTVYNAMLNREAAIMAIADGLGSCSYSEDGARIAVSTVVDVLTNSIKNMQALSDETMIGFLKAAYQHANTSIQAEADQRELPFLSFDTTLTTAVLFDDGTCYYGHIGDDGMVALFADGSYRMVTKRNEGEQASSVIPLSQKKDWSFGRLSDPVATVVLMTDGVLDSVVGSAQFNNRVFYPFFAPVFENIMKNKEDVNDMRTFWNSYLGSDEFRARVTDDITFGLIQNTQLMTTVTPVPFDENKWNEETEGFQRNKEEALGYTQSVPAENSAKKRHVPLSLSTPSLPQFVPDSAPADVASCFLSQNDKAVTNTRKQPLGVFAWLGILLASMIICCLISASIGKAIGFQEGYNKGIAEGHEPGYDEEDHYGKPMEDEQAPEHCDADNEATFNPSEDESSANQLLDKVSPPPTPTEPIITFTPQQTSPIPTTTPTCTFALPVSSPSVDKNTIDSACIQEFVDILISLGYLDSNFEVDNNYEDSLITAIKHFQYDAHLPITGDLDANTIKVLVDKSHR